MWKCPVLANSRSRFSDMEILWSSEGWSRNYTQVAYLPSLYQESTYHESARDFPLYPMSRVQNHMDLPKPSIPVQLLPPSLRSQLIHSYCSDITAVMVAVQWMIKAHPSFNRTIQTGGEGGVFAWGLTNLHDELLENHVYSGRTHSNKLF